MTRQCPSCGGFCKKSGCERDDIKGSEMKEIKLPPLPRGYTDGSALAYGDVYDDEHMQAYARAAVEADRQARGAPANKPSDETIRLVGVIANKIEDGTLFNAGIFSRKELAEKVREVLIFAAQPEPKPQQQEKDDPFGCVYQTSDGWIFVPKGEAICISNSWREIPVYTTPQPQQIPEGYKLVPVEPTPEMKTAGISVEVYPESKPEIGALTWAEAKEIYQAMLEAAPEPKEP